MIIPGAIMIVTQQDGAGAQYGAEARDYYHKLVKAVEEAVAGNVRINLCRLSANGGVL